MRPVDDEDPATAGIAAALADLERQIDAGEWDGLPDDVRADDPALP